MGTEELLVEAGEIERDGQGRASCEGGARLGLKGGFDNPFGRVGGAGALVGGGEADVVAVDQFKQEREGDRLVDEAQKRGIQRRGLEREGEDLDFFDAVAGGQFKRLGREFVRPCDVGDLGGEEDLEAFGGRGVSVNLGLGDDSVQGGGGRISEHGGARIRSGGRR